jgi:hypothetical protein
MRVCIPMHNGCMTQRSQNGTRKRNVFVSPPWYWRVSCVCLVVAHTQAVSTRKAYGKPTNLCLSLPIAGESLQCSPMGIVGVNPTKHGDTLASMIVCRFSPRFCNPMWRYGLAHGHVSTWQWGCFSLYPISGANLMVLYGLTTVPCANPANCKG